MALKQYEHGIFEDVPVGVNRIYAYIDLGDSKRIGQVKFGQTKNDSFKRISEQVGTFGGNVEVLFSVEAVKNGAPFTDKDFYNFLGFKGLKNVQEVDPGFSGTEWFIVGDNFRQKSIQLINEFKGNAYRLPSVKHDDDGGGILLYPHQKDFVEKAGRFFCRGKEFVFDAKPRSGKTLATYALILEKGFSNVLIVTSHPAIGTSWYSDYLKYFAEYEKSLSEEYFFVSNSDFYRGREGAVTVSEWLDIKARDNDAKAVVFLSLQDLKGSVLGGGSIAKLLGVEEILFDLVVADEAHVGVDTERSENVFNSLKYSKILYVSGTMPDFIRARGFKESQVYRYTIKDEVEQNRSKINSERLPEIKFVGVETGCQSPVGELLEVDSRGHRFIRQEDFESYIVGSIKQIIKHYDFKTTMVYVNTVAQASIVEKTLSKTFKKTSVVMVSGSSYGDNANAYLEQVKRSILLNENTIIVSCGRLTTGITIPELEAVFNLSSQVSFNRFFQTAFRPQNKCKISKKGLLKYKDSSYLFDFNLNRMIAMSAKYHCDVVKAYDKNFVDEISSEDYFELISYLPLEKVAVRDEELLFSSISKKDFTSSLFVDAILRLYANNSLIGLVDEGKILSMTEEMRAFIEEIVSKVESASGKERKVLDFTVNKKKVLEGFKGERLDDSEALEPGEESSRQRESLDKALRQILDESGANTRKYRDTASKILEKFTKKTAEIEESYVCRMGAIAKSTLLSNETETDVAGEFASAKKDFYQEVERAKQQAVEEAVADFEKISEDERVSANRVAVGRFISLVLESLKASPVETSYDNFLSNWDSEVVNDLFEGSAEDVVYLVKGGEREVGGELVCYDGLFSKDKFDLLSENVNQDLRDKMHYSKYFGLDQDLRMNYLRKSALINTPLPFVRGMMNRVEKHIAGKIDENYRVLVINSTGTEFILESAKIVFDKIRKNFDNDTDCWEHVLNTCISTVYADKYSEMISNKLIKLFCGVDYRNYVVSDDFRRSFESDFVRMLEKANMGEKLKFDIVVGNPPYQDEKNFALYDKFFLKAKDVSDSVLMITKGAWTKRVGKGLREDFLNEIMSNRTVYVKHYLNEFLFGKVARISGGVTEFYWCRNRGSGEITLAETVSAKGVTLYSGHLLLLEGNVFSHVPEYELASCATRLTGEIGGFSKIVGATSAYGPSSNFSDYREGAEGDYSIPLLVTRKEGSAYTRKTVYCKEPAIRPGKIKDVFKEKIAIVKASPGGGRKVISHLTRCSTALSQSYLEIGKGLSVEEIDWIESILTTKTLRAIVRGFKPTQNMSAKVFRNVPYFKPDGTVNASTPIPELDVWMQKKLGLSEEVVEWIDNTVAM